MKQIFDFDIFKQQNRLDATIFSDIDLQLHSYYSDSFVSPSFYLTSYQQNIEYKYLSISDHNTLDGYNDPDFLRTLTLSKATIIPCVEIDCHSSMDILVYAKSSSLIEHFKEEISQILTQENWFRESCMREIIHSLKKCIEASLCQTEMKMSCIKPHRCMSSYLNL